MLVSQSVSQFHLHMHFRKSTIFKSIFALLMVLASFTAALASEFETAKVFVGSQEVFEVTGLQSLSPEERAKIINRRITTILHDSSLAPGKIKVRPLDDGTPAVVLGDFVILEVTRVDARRFKISQSELAGWWSEILKAELIHLQPLYLRTAKFDIKMLAEHNVLLFIVQS